MDVSEKYRKNDSGFKKRKNEPKIIKKNYIKTINHIFDLTKTKIQKYFKLQNKMTLLDSLCATFEDIEN